MSVSFLCRSAFLGAVLASATPAFALTADRACPYAEVIVSLADTALAGRSELGRFVAARYGADAAYLKMHYEPLSEPDTTELLQSLVEAKVRDAYPLALAWRIRTEGYDAAMVDVGTDASNDPYVAMSATVMRAAILAGAEQATLDLIAAAPSGDRLGYFRNLATAVIDQPDDLKARLQQMASERGLDMLVVGLAAVQSDPQIYQAAVKGLDADWQKTAFNQWLMYPAILGNAVPRSPSGSSYLDDLSDLLRAVALQPEADFLNTFLNQTGLAAETNAAAAAVNAAYDDGRLDPASTLDASWLLTYRLLAFAVGEERVRRTLAVSINSGRVGRDKAIDVIDWIIAVEALRPYLTGETDVLPDMPVTADSVVAGQWESWTSLAEAATSSASISSSLSEPDAAILAELLFAKGDYAGLADPIAAAPMEVRTQLSEDFAKRLDRQCDDITWYPGEAVLLVGEPLYTLDPA